MEERAGERRHFKGGPSLQLSPRSFLAGRQGLIAVPAAALDTRALFPLVS
jgi:hypothetical protein